MDPVKSCQQRGLNEPTAVPDPGQSCALEASLNIQAHVSPGLPLYFQSLYMGYAHTWPQVQIGVFST